MTKIKDCLQYSTESEFSLEEFEDFENEILLYNERAIFYYKTVVADLEDSTPIDFKCFEKTIILNSKKFENECSIPNVKLHDSNPTTPTANDSNHVTTVFKKPYFSIFEIFNTLKNICDILISTIIRISPENSNNKKSN